MRKTDQRPTTLICYRTSSGHRFIFTDHHVFVESPLGDSPWALSHRALERLILDIQKKKSISQESRNLTT